MTAQERFTDCVRKVMQLANQEARRLNQEYIGTEHVLIGLMKENGISAKVFLNLGIDATAVMRRAREAATPGPDMVSMRKLPQTPACKGCIEAAVKHADDFGHEQIGTEHILLGLLSTMGSLAAGILESFGVTVEKVKEEIREIISDASVQEDENSFLVEEFQQLPQDEAWLILRIEILRAAAKVWFRQGSGDGDVVDAAARVLRHEFDQWQYGK